MGSTCSLCFPLKTAQGLRISSNVIRQKLQRHKTTELGVLGLVDQTHPAAAEPLDDAIMRDGLADHGGMTHERRVVRRANAGSQTNLRSAARRVRGSRTTQFRTV